MKKFILAGLLGMLVVPFYAQKAPIRFGKPSMEELKKSVYDIDTSASAIVLCNYGHFDAENLDFTQIIRLKILKKSGLKYASFTFRSLSKAAIRGKTFNLVNGKVETDKLSSKEIYDEEIYNGLYVTKVTMPNVKKGSVIDISVSYQGIPFDWYFQKNIPMLYSELNMEPSRYIEFRKNYFGYIPFYVASRSRWVTHNVPAFQPEPYMGAEENYLAHFEFEITSITLPEQMTHEYATTWQRINELLLGSEYFGGALNSTPRFFRQMADSINKKAGNDREKVRMALDKIHKINWNNQLRITTVSNTGLKSAFSQKKGSVADINLSLIVLLRKLGFTAYPVVLRTRKEGYLSPVNPTLRNLDYVVAYAKIGDKYYLLDGTDKYMPFPLLPKRCMNGQGRLVDYDTTAWVPLTNNVRSVKRSLFNLKLDKNGNLSGTKTTLYSGYAGYNFREKYRNIGSKEDYLDSIVRNNQNLQILTDTLQNLDNPYEPVTEQQTLVLKNQGFAMDTLVYLNVTPERIIENPFKQNKRLYPVDFVHPFEKTFTVLIKLPDNYRVAEMPKTERVLLPNNAGNFTYRIMEQYNQLTVYCRLIINKPLFSQAEYNQLKTFYTEVISKEAKPVLLKTL